jgi:hypothetical protein
MRLHQAACAVLVLAKVLSAAPASGIAIASPGEARSITLAAGGRIASIAVDSKDLAAVKLAAGLLAGDIERVSGGQPLVVDKPGATTAIIAGTLGHSELIDGLVVAGKLRESGRVKGKWETTLWQVVDRPFPGVSRALVIVGSDRRGTAYGLLRVSEAIGVSPWYWWADVPVTHRERLAVKLTAESLVDQPAVKYRGIFINDEDWGMNQWAKKTFDPQFGSIGPKTYEKVFELMLRLRLNYIWPAMHEVSAEFASAPQNAVLADQYGIVAGSSHCEPMLSNNVHWDEQKQGRWNYSLNHDVIHSYWEDMVKARANTEAVWTLGIRGIHDRGMQAPPNDLPGKIGLVSQVFKEQRELLDRYVTKNWRPVAQAFVPYKEVLPIYDGGLKVPDDVTIMWVDDNFGYIRRLSTPQERSRPGGAGVYWHLSYYGGPHSYTWINTTAPALMWEELHKAWDNQARTTWVINVGDLKPMEIGIDYFSQLAWNPDGFPLGAQQKFLEEFASRNFGAQQARAIADLLKEFYRLGTVRKPELMNREWALRLTPDTAAQLERDYRALLAREQEIAAAMPAASRDSYTETIGFPARVLGGAGLIFMADRKAQQGIEGEANQKEISRLRDFLNAEVESFNERIAGGKWKYMMPGMVTNQNLTSWSSQVRWPWGEPAAALAKPGSSTPATPQGTPGRWRDAASADKRIAKARAGWVQVDGLGPSARAMLVTPQDSASGWREDDAGAPALEYAFVSRGGDSEALIDFLPTFRMYPGSLLRVAVSVDEGRPALWEVPGSSGAENENGPVRSSAVQDNYSRLRVPLAGLGVGRHVLRIRAVDPGVAIDRLALP